MVKSVFPNVPESLTICKYLKIFYLIACYTRIICYGGECLADDEGFPGEPRNPSVLIGFADHVAHSIWSGHVCTYFIAVIRK